ncbi:hypothetical protein QBC44DRAFT_61428 [Cladorrhinum sp. PSN332]|nr:hypothetical protein QBC44DRAFT_61428 [Cladorrhinum sp. PSN332]
MVMNEEKWKYGNGDCTKRGDFGGWLLQLVGVWCMVYSVIFFIFFSKNSEWGDKTKNGGGECIALNKQTGRRVWVVVDLVCGVCLQFLGLPVFPTLFPTLVISHSVCIIAIDRCDRVPF